MTTTCVVTTYRIQQLNTNLNYIQSGNVSIQIFVRAIIPTLYITQKRSKKNIGKQN